MSEYQSLTWRQAEIVHTQICDRANVGGSFGFRRLPKLFCVVCQNYFVFPNHHRLFCSVRQQFVAFPPACQQMWPTVAFLVQQMWPTVAFSVQHGDFGPWLIFRHATAINATAVPVIRMCLKLCGWSANYCCSNSLVNISHYFDIMTYNNYNN